MKPEIGKVKKIRHLTCLGDGVFYGALVSYIKYGSESLMLFITSSGSYKLVREKDFVSAEACRLPKAMRDSLDRIARLHLAVNKELSRLKIINIAHGLKWQ